MIHGIKCTFTFIPLSINIKTSIKLILMSVLHHEEILETCFDEAVEEFMTANKLDYEMFRQIEDHEGVMLAIEKNARRKFDDLCI